MHNDDFSFTRPKQDCVLSGRFTRAEDAEFRELAAAEQVPVKSLVRAALMEWKNRRQEATQ